MVYPRPAMMLIILTMISAVFAQPTVDTCVDDRCQQMTRAMLQDEIFKLIDLIDDLRVENRRLYEELAVKVENLTEASNCTCPAGPTVPPGPKEDPGSSGSVDINCDTIPCVNGNCTDILDDYLCDCVGGWTGKNCSTSLSGADLVPYIVPGARVVRNPEDWEWGNEDCGGPGTVISAVDSNGWCRVQWDCGVKGSYPMGKNGFYDLLLTNL